MSRSAAGLDFAAIAPSRRHGRRSSVFADETSRSPTACADHRRCGRRPSGSAPSRQVIRFPPRLPPGCGVHGPWHFARTQDAALPQIPRGDLAFPMPLKIGFSTARSSAGNYFFRHEMSAAPAGGLEWVRARAVVRTDPRSRTTFATPPGMPLSPVRGDRPGRSRARGLLPRPICRHICKGRRPRVLALLLAHLPDGRSKIALVRACVVGYSYKSAFVRGDWEAACRRCATPLGWLGPKSRASSLLP